MLNDPLSEKGPYMWVTTSPELSGVKLHVTPSHASQRVGAHGSPFQPILWGTSKESFSSCIAFAATTIKFKQVSTKIHPQLSKFTLRNQLPFKRPNPGVATNVGLVYMWCIVAIINTDNGIKEPTHGYQNCTTSQLWIFGGYIKVRESLSTWVIIWTSTHFDTRAILPRYEGYCMVYVDPNGIETQILSNTHSLLVSKSVQSLL